MYNITSKDFFSNDKNLNITVFKDSEENIFFLPKEIEEYLGYSNLSRAIRNSPSMEKGVDWDSFDGDKLSLLKDLCNQDSCTVLVNSTSSHQIVLYESGFYALCFRSNKENAVAFRKWVTSEVLPEIRKNGKYTVKDSKQKMGLKEMANELEGAIKIAELFGLKGNMAKISANSVVKKEIGKDLLCLLDINLKAEVQENKMTPTEIGMRLVNNGERALSASSVNRKLEALGFQESHRDNKNRLKWSLTEKAINGNYGHYEDTQKKNSEGNPVLQIKWFSKILDELS